jgi:hypothetical protein
MADGNFLATYLKIGVEYDFDIKTNKIYSKRAVLTETHS